MKIQIVNVILCMSIGFAAGFPWGKVHQYSQISNGGLTCEIRTDSAFPKVGVK